MCNQCGKIRDIFSIKPSQSYQGSYLLLRLWPPLLTNFFQIPLVGLHNTLSHIVPKELDTLKAEFTLRGPCRQTCLFQSFQHTMQGCYMLFPCFSVHQNVINVVMHILHTLQHFPHPFHKGTTCSLQAKWHP